MTLFGDPELAIRLKSNLVVDDATGCWNMVNRSGRRGYSSMSANGRNVMAHRLAFEVWRGPIPAGIYVCHHCDNRRCVNPDHLFLGTHQDNMDDRERKGRNVLPPVKRGISHPQAKLSADDVRAIRSATGSSYVIGRQFNIAHGVVRRIRRRERYQDVAGEWNGQPTPRLRCEQCGRFYASTLSACPNHEAAGPQEG